MFFVNVHSVWYIKGMNAVILENPRDSRIRQSKKISSSLGYLRKKAGFAMYRLAMYQNKNSFDQQNIA